MEQALRTVRRLETCYRRRLTDNLRMAEAQPKDRRRIYVSYASRDDAVAIRLIEDLRREFGEDRVVTSSASTAAAPDDLKREFELLLDSCAVVLVVIGEGWVADRISASNARDFDFTAFEAARLLDDRERVVIPVLVDGRVLTRATELPIGLAALTTCEAFTLGEEDWAVRLVELHERIGEALQRVSARDEARKREEARAREQRAAEARARLDAPSDVSMPVFDGHVQFTVFRPSVVQPRRWYPLPSSRTFPSDGPTRIRTNPTRSPTCRRGRLARSATRSTISGA